MISWVIGQMAAGRSPAEIVCRLPILPGWPPAAAEAATRKRQRLFQHAGKNGGGALVSFGCARTACLPRKFVGKWRVETHASEPTPPDP